MKLKSLTCLLAVLPLLTVSAQDVENRKDNKSYPNLFVGLHGGAQTTFTNYHQGDLITPVVGVSFGGYFSPVLGARLHVSGWQDKGGIKEMGCTYNYNYTAGNVDLLLNLTNIFSKHEDRFFNVILLGGVGLNYAWNNDDFHALTSQLKGRYSSGWENHQLSHAYRGGIMFDFNIAKKWGVNLEVGANSHSDLYNSKISNKSDWSAYATVGVVAKFGHKKKSAPVASVEVEPKEEWTTRIDTIWYDEVSYKEVVESVTYTDNVFYEIKKSEPVPTTLVDAVVAFVKANKNCKVSIVGYSDKETGTRKFNMKLSQERAQNVEAALLAAGVDKACISTEWKGDTVQPFAENDKNRAVVVKTTGEGVKKEPVTIKKFRTEEVKYRVR